MDSIRQEFFRFLGASIIFFPLTGLAIVGVYRLIRSATWPYYQKVLISWAIIAGILLLLDIVGPGFGLYAQLDLLVWLIVGLIFQGRPRAAPPASPRSYE